MDDHVLDRGHGDFQEISIGCVCKVAIYFALWRSVQVDEFVHKVFAGLLPALCIPLEIGEPEFGDRAGSDLTLEKVNLVEE